MTTTERDIAELVASGALPSPTHWCGSGFYRLRVSGTGVAFRAAVKEYVYRPAAVWLAPAMVARVAGLPVISEHPKDGVLDGPAFYRQIVGICLLGFVEGDDLMAVARVIDTKACQILNSARFDTSPSCEFGEGEGTMIRLEDGSAPLLLEGVPRLLDHLALLDSHAGVWTRPATDAAPGVEIDERPHRQTEKAA